MDYYTQTSPSYLLKSSDLRKSPRKAARGQVSIGDANHGIIRGQTLDLSTGGLSVMLPVALQPNSTCAVRFDMFVDGKPLRIAGAGRVVYCSCVGMDGFRVGMKFKAQDAHMQSLLEDFLAR